MKAIILCFTILLCVPIVLSDDHRCYSQKDCAEDECCTGGISTWVKGFCRKLAQEGGFCDPDPPTAEKYFLRCPCVEGLKCVRPKEDVSTKLPECQRE